MSRTREPKPDANEWSVVVGNIGCVYTGASSTDAIEAYVVYREQAINGYGRSANEQVTLLADGEVQQEWNPKEETDND